MTSMEQLRSSQDLTQMHLHVDLGVEGLMQAGSVVPEASPQEDSALKTWDLSLEVAVVLEALKLICSSNSLEHLLARKVLGSAALREARTLKPA